MKRRNAQILSILLSLCVLGTSPVYAEDFSSDTITAEAESQNMASDEAASDAEFSVEEDGNPATDKNPTTDKNPSTDKDPATDEDPATDTDPASDTDVTLEEEEPGNQEEANSDEFVDCLLYTSDRKHLQFASIGAADAWSGLEASTTCWI